MQLGRVLGHVLIVALSFFLEAHLAIRKDYEQLCSSGQNIKDLLQSRSLSWRG